MWQRYEIASENPNNYLSLTKQNLLFYDNLTSFSITIKKIMFIFAPK